MLASLLMASSLSVFFFLLEEIGAGGGLCQLVCRYEGWESRS